MITNKREKITKVNLIVAIRDAVWYNGLEGAIAGWKKLQKCESPPERYGADEAGDIDQLQLIWMMCVILFGEYGISPRYGWINDLNGFHEFIDLITGSEADDND